MCDKTENFKRNLKDLGRGIAHVRDGYKTTKYKRQMEEIAAYYREVMNIDDPYPVDWEEKAPVFGLSSHRLAYRFFSDYAHPFATDAANQIAAYIFAAGFQVRKECRDPDPLIRLKADDRIMEILIAYDNGHDRLPTPNNIRMTMYGLTYRNDNFTSQAIKIFLEEGNVAQSLKSIKENPKLNPIKKMTVRV